MNGRLLRDVCAGLDPTIVSQVLPDSIWNQSLDTGRAFEWTVLASLAYGARQRSLEVKYPVLDYRGGPEFYSLWNVIPTHYTGKVGHAHERRDRATLARRFLQALVPKLLFLGEGVTYSVFREGCPYHMIMAEEYYEERPDILVVKGVPLQGYPRIVANDQLIEFAFSFFEGPLVSGHLRVINSSFLPIEDKTPDSAMSVPIWGIVECSINKSSQVATSQLQTYTTLFKGLVEPRILLVTGNQLSIEGWNSLNVDLCTADTSAITAQLQRVGMEAIDLLAIL